MERVQMNTAVAVQSEQRLLSVTHHTYQLRVVLARTDRGSVPKRQGSNRSTTYRSRQEKEDQSHYSRVPDRQTTERTHH